MQKEQLISEIAITAELCGRSFSDKALVVFAEALSEYPPEQVFKALEKCRQGLDGPFTLPAVISRIDDGRPGAEEAWASVPHSEQATAVWTEDAQQAFYAGSHHLLERGDAIAARMAFKESYERIVRQARALRKPLNVLISQGWDQNDRQVKIAEAVSSGLITLERAKKALPSIVYDGKPGTNLKLVS